MTEPATQMSGNKRVTFISPYAEHTPAPDPALLRDLIMNSGDEYWQAAAGDAALWFDEDDRENGKRARLIFKEDEKLGFFLIYVDPENGDYFCPVVAIENDQRVMLEDPSGGEPLDIKLSNLLDKDTTWKVVEYFQQHGERLPNLTWQEWR